MLSSRLFSVLLVFLIVGAQAQAQTVMPNNISVCEDQSEKLERVNRHADNCQHVSSFVAIDPQKKQVWVLATVTFTDERLSSGEPIGLFISGKASSEIFINGERLGANGLPAAHPQNEIAGVMDYVLYVPVTKLHAGTNELALRMSGHSGWLKLAGPIHFIGFADYTDPINNTLSYYWVSLLPFGVLLIGAFYMGMLAIVRRQYWPDFLLPFMSLVAACQLLAEVYRGLTAYFYWVHDLRLIAILACSTLFGFSLFLYTVLSLKFKLKHRLSLVLAVNAVTVSALVMLPGFDIKSAFALLFPTTVALIMSLFSLFSADGSSTARRLSIVFTLFLLVMVLSPADFLNVTFYYIIAALMVVLFGNEIYAYIEQRNARLEEKTRADKLQIILQQNAQRDTTEFINVSGAGTIEKVATTDIEFCKGAGDYVELMLSSGKSILHSERLVELEKTLPSLFLRVHRSYIVNTASIKSLQRKPSGVGELLLKSDQLVPVSRRIMPSVRDKF